MLHGPWAAFLLGLALMPTAKVDGPQFLDKSLETWIDQLAKSPKPAVRRSAAFAIGRLGDEAYLAVPDLARRLRDEKDAGVREMIASALGEIIIGLRENKSRWVQAGPALENALLNDEDARVRRGAAYGLGAFGPTARNAVPSLRKALQDRSPVVRQNAAWALGRVGPELDDKSVNALCESLGDADVMVRRDAAAALGKTGRERGAAGAKSLLALVKTEKDDVVRKAALDSLSHVAGPEHRFLASDLYPLLKSKDLSMARSAAFVLGNLGGEEAAAALPILRNSLSAPDAKIQALAAAALAGIGSEASPAVLDLARTLTASKDPFVRRNCAIALGSIGPDARAAAPALALALKPIAKAPANPPPDEPYEEARKFAAEALARINYPGNEKAMKAISAAIRSDPNPDVRQRCVWALFRLDNLEKYDLDKVLAKVMDEKSLETSLLRYDAARLMTWSQRKEAPDRAIELLLEMIKNRKLVVYNKSDAKVEGTGSESSGGASSVKEQRGGDARFMAAEALGWLGEKGKSRKDVIEALRDAAKDKEPRLKEMALKALDRLGVDK
jgi:HEAT repeat protein